MNKARKLHGRCGRNNIITGKYCFFSLNIFLTSDKYKTELELLLFITVSFSGMNIKCSIQSHDTEIIDVLKEVPPTNLDKTVSRHIGRVVKVFKINEPIFPAL